MAGLVCMFLVGCPHNRYQIELKPKADALERSLTCWRDGGGENAESNIKEFPEAELKRIAGAYNKPAPPSEPRKYTFLGEFVGKTPNDVGGSGNYTHWKTRMGTLSLYAERFRGSDDLAGALQARQDAADTLTTLLLGWFCSEIKADPAFGKLEKFVDNDFRRDMRNLAVYCWTAGAVKASRPERLSEQAESDDVEFIVRVARYFTERDYLTPAMLPELVRIVEQHDADRFVKLIRTLVASRMEIQGDEQAAQRLSFLKDLDRAKHSLDKYLAATDEYKTFLKKWEQEHKDDADATQPEPGELLGQLVSRILGLGPGPNDQLEVKLACPTRPVATNGVWKEDAKQVVWSSEINAVDKPPPPAMPALFYAFWSAPDEEFQRKHFGKVVLEGKPLAEYCVWRKGLSEAEGKQWDEFVSSLTPGNDLPKRLDAFHFAGEPKPPATNEGKPKPLADKPRELIKAGLQGS